MALSNSVLAPTPVLLESVARSSSASASLICALPVEHVRLGLLEFSDGFLLGRQGFALVDVVERVALGDFRSFREVDLGEQTFDPRPDLHGLHRLEVPVVFEVGADRREHRRGDDDDRWRHGRWLLRTATTHEADRDGETGKGKGVEAKHAWLN